VNERTHPNSDCRLTLTNTHTHAPHPKAGLISTLNARTSICACANPIGSRYNPHLTVAENINLPPTLLTRFDLIYLMLDKCDEEKDRKLARHLVSLFHEVVPKRAMQEVSHCYAEEEEEDILCARVRACVCARATHANTPALRTHPPILSLSPSPTHPQELFIEKDVLKEYIAFARTRVNPQLNEEAIEELVKAYGTLRQDGRDRKVVVATPRQLESLIRISEALSRMRLSEVVGRAEVEEAVRLWYTAMQGSAAGDTGDIDMDNIFTGTTTAARQAMSGLPDTLRAIIQDPSARPMTVDDLYSAVQRANAASGSGAYMCAVHHAVQHLSLVHLSATASRRCTPVQASHDNTHAPIGDVRTHTLTHARPLTRRR
jgi:DNA replication licensing factor MCM4